MHWLPLVAMVIASALPFPHSPVSRIAAATPEPGFDDRRERRHDRAAALAAPPLDHNSHGNAPQTDYDAAAAAALGQRGDRRNLQSREDHVKSSVDEETSAVVKVENGATRQSNSRRSGDDRRGVTLDVPTGGTLRTEDIPTDDSLPKDHEADGSRRQETHTAVGPPANHKGQRGAEPTVPSEELRDTPTTRTPGAGRSPAREPGLDGILGDEMFLDAHPRVLFSPSPSPPERPPLLLMLETGLLEEDREEQEDADAHIEGHGDRAIDRSVTLSWADAARVVKRNKRSHLTDRRRGEKSVCESESVWVTDKTTAIDSHGQKVTILQEIQTQTGPLKQYFYETRCRQAEQWSNASRSRGGGVFRKPVGTGVAGAGCLGVDKKQWVSECKAKQSFVRALTRDANNRTGWRWIRIDSSCVCVLLYRANQAQREVLTRKGRG